MPKSTTERQEGIISFFHYVVNKFKAFLFLEAQRRSFSGPDAPLAWRRVIAFIIDFAAIGFLKIILTATYLKAIRNEFIYLPLSTKSSLSFNLGKVDLLLSSTLIIVYFTTFLYLTNGLTLGKMIYKLKVYPKNGQDLSLLQCLGRSLGYLSLVVKQTMFFGWVLYLFNDKFRSFPDFFSSTHTLCEHTMEQHENEEDLFTPRDGHCAIDEFRFTRPNNIIYLPGPESKEENITDDQDHSDEEAA